MQNDNSNITTQPTLTTRISTWWNSVVIFTRSMFILCIVLYLIQWITEIPQTQTVCYNYMHIIRDFQVYRILTAAFYHVTFLHIVFNMFALVSLGLMLERKLGTMNMTWTSLLSAVLCSMMQLLITTLFYLTARYVITTWDFLNGLAGQMLGECGVGYSGVLFAYLVIGTHYSADDGNGGDQVQQSQSLFGLINVPVLIYPWLLLIVSQLLMVGVSFWAHLSGILIGYLFTFVILKRNWWKRFVHWTDQKLIPSSLRNLNSFVPSPLPDGAVQIINSTQDASSSSSSGHVLGDGTSFSSNTVTGRLGNCIVTTFGQIKDAMSRLWLRITLCFSTIGMNQEQRQQPRSQYGRLDRGNAGDDDAVSVGADVDTSIQDNQHPLASSAPPSLTSSSVLSSSNAPTLVDLEMQDTQGAATSTPTSSTLQPPPATRNQQQPAINAQRVIPRVVAEQLQQQQIAAASTPTSPNKENYFASLDKGRRLGTN